MNAVRSEKRRTATGYSLLSEESSTRIYVPDGPQFGTYNFETVSSPANNKKYVTALKNVLDSQHSLNPTTDFSSIGTKKVNMVCIPGIFYGSEIKKGSVELNHYVTGNLAAQARDSNKNGELIQTSGSNSGFVVGHVLYNYGIILLTGSGSLHDNHQDYYFSTLTKESPTWLSFGTGLTEIGTAVSNGNIVSSSYEIKCQGTNKVPTLTMLAHAEKNELNYSHNPTFLDLYQTGNVNLDQNIYFEEPSNIKNIKKSKFTGHLEEFENITYISKIGIYDKNKNLIGIATLANPVKKTEIKDYMFKLRVDF